MLLGCLKDLSAAGFCYHLLVAAKIALESCCLSYLVCALALLPACQLDASLNCDLLCVLNVGTWNVLALSSSLDFQTTVKFPRPVSYLQELMVLLLSLSPHQFREPSVTSHFQEEVS